MCPRWGDAVPQFLWVHPRAIGVEKLSRKPSLSAGDAPLTLPSHSPSPAGARRLLSPAGQCCFVKHGPEVLMSDGGTQHLPWPHPEAMPRSRSGAPPQKTGPSARRPALGEDSSVPGARRSSGSIGSRRAGTGALSR